MNVCHEGGGPKGMERHVKVNKKVFVRERINRILDPETGMVFSIGDCIPKVCNEFHFLIVPCKTLFILSYRIFANGKLSYFKSSLVTLTV